MITGRGIKVAQYLCLFPGIFLIVSGLLLLFLPAAASELFDLHDMELLQQPVTLAMGVRQLAIGLMTTSLVLSSQTKALAWIMLIGGIVPLTDFIVFSSSIGWVSALRHAAPVPFIFGLGFYLLAQQKK